MSERRPQSSRHHSLDAFDRALAHAHKRKLRAVRLHRFLIRNAARNSVQVYTSRSKLEVSGVAPEQARKLARWLNLHSGHRIKAKMNSSSSRYLLLEIQDRQ